MIVKSDQYRYSMNGTILTLLLLVLVVTDLRLLQHFCRNSAAWTVTNPLSHKSIGGLPKRTFDTLGTSTDSQRRRYPVNSVVLRSMTPPHETNVKRDSIDIATPTGTTNLANFKVRDCTHGELNLVADIIMDSFYNYTDSGSVWKQLTKLAELNRIQQNFPYGPDKAHHRMLVVTSTNHSMSDSVTSICGFVDIDTRIPNRFTSYQYNPRPYLSDLCIHPKYRRNGLASLLIQSCEDYCRNHHRSYSNSHAVNDIYQRNDAWSTDDDPLGPEIFIRVEAKNTIAIEMYQKLGYSILSDHADSSNSDILILHKSLQ